MKRHAAVLRFVVPCATAAAVFAAVSSVRAHDFAAVNASPNPDTLVPFDTNDPAGHGPASVTLTGNFIRGVELTGPTTGWYVATDDISGSPTGFFRLENGVATLVGPLPFLSGSAGGLTFSQKGDFLYWLSDPPDSYAPGQDDTLFRIDFDGTVTELVEVTLASDPAILIAGLALDANTGTLYALEHDNNALLTIDIATGVAAVVGTGLGISANAVGGMDFAFDGSLFIVTSFGLVYEVDPSTGLAGPALGDLGFNASSIAAIPTAGCLGDIAPAAGDGTVDVNDLLILIGAWGSNSADADLNDDGFVDVNDLLILIGAWGPC